MNIVQINHYVGPTKYGPTYRATHLAREWEKLGHHVTIIGASYSHLFIQQPSFNGMMHEENEEGIRYVMFKTPQYSGNGFGRLWNILVFIGQLFVHARWLRKDVSPDVIIAGSADVLDSIPAAYLARRTRATFVRDVRDLWPLTLLEFSTMSANHPFIMLLQWAENFSYRRADRVITTLSHSRDYMASHGLDASKWSYIPQGIDAASWQVNEASLPQLHADTLARLRSEGRFIIAYAGSHGQTDALDVLLDAAALSDKRTTAFVFMGQGNEKESLQKKAAALELENVRLLPPIPKHAMPAFLHAVNATYIGWPKNSIYQYGISPNKMMDYMMAGKPIIHSVETPADPVGKCGCGISVAPEDPNAIAGAVRQLMNLTPDERDVMGGRGIAYVKEHHDYAALAAQYLEKVANRKVNVPTSKSRINMLYRQNGKRILDLMIVIPALVLLSPFLLCLGLLIRVMLGSPVLFRHERPGLHGNLFTMLKFRTMTNETDARGQLLADPLRVTKFGNILRSSSLDELPELFNVLKGNMSIVGPRPLLTQYLRHYSAEQMQRHDVPPGITGWAQINGRTSVAWEKRFAMDVWYVHNQSVFLDLKILLLTFWKVIRREGVGEAGDGLPFGAHASDGAKATQNASLPVKAC